MVQVSYREREVHSPPPMTMPKNPDPNQLSVFDHPLYGADEYTPKDPKPELASTERVTAPPPSKPQARPLRFRWEEKEMEVGPATAEIDEASLTVRVRLTVLLRGWQAAS